MPYVDFVWRSVITSGVAAVVAVPLVRSAYVRFYLSKRLYFERWTNLSKNEKLDVGDSLAELLFFELEAIRKLLEQAKNDSGLWNEKSALPALERSFDGYPEFVRHADLLGLSGQIAKLVRLVLLTRPQSIRGTIHEYGPTLRFQLVLERFRRRDDKSPVPCWTTSCEAGKPELIPEAVAELAHKVVVDLDNVQGFKSPQTFRYFTSGLRHHLAFNSLKHETLLKNAVDSYRLAIEHEGSNAPASCNLGDLLYHQFTYETNELAMEAYLRALQTDKPLLRARAFRGLANSLCQRRQRHKRGGLGALEDAMRWAKFAGALCSGRSALPPEEQASIKKAEAYSRQVWAELGPLNAEERKRALQDAVDLYRRAIDLNNKFTVAYNNVSYLYLKRAEKALDDSLTSSGSVRDDLLENAAEDLSEAEKWCQDAINSDPSFHMAYDNKGNISVAWARIESTSIQSRLTAAIESYHEGLSYQPSYREAYSDLAGANSRLFCSGLPKDRGARATSGAQLPNGFNEQHCHYAIRAWQHHWDALTYTSDPTSKANACEQFTRALSTYGLPRPSAVCPSEELTRAIKVNCTCLSREAES